MRTLAATILAVVVGIGTGVGSYTFIYARGYSYVTDDPAACANCHIMQDHFEAWQASSHGRAAVCNDCHAPSAIIPKFAVKGWNGFWHSFAFTTGRYADPLVATGLNRDVADQACRKCHQAITADIEGHMNAEQLRCIRCHANVGHMTR